MEATTSEATPVAMTPADEEEEELMRPISEPQPPSNPAPSNEMFEIEVSVIGVRRVHCVHGWNIYKPYFQVIDVDSESTGEDDDDEDEEDEEDLSLIHI